MTSIEIITNPALRINEHNTSGSRRHLSEKQKLRKSVYS